MYEIIAGTYLTDKFTAQVGDISALCRAVKKCLQVDPPVKVRIFICHDELAVQKKYRKMFGEELHQRAFSQMSTKTVYISPQKRLFSTPLRDVLAHEIAHIYIEAHFGERMTPYNLHEIMAQYAHSYYRKHL